VELLSATGLRPYRLLHGDTKLVNEGETVLRVDACPLVKANAGFVLQSCEKFAALVGSTGCDMSRRLFEVLGETTSIPFHIFNNPRTDNKTIFFNEIDRLALFLNRVSGMKLTRGSIKNEIEKWEAARERLRALDAKRRAHPSLSSTTAFHRAVADFHQGNIDKINKGVEADEESSYKPRIFLLGSPVPYEADEILSLIESRLRIVGDFNCGLSRFLDISVKNKNIEGIKDAYYGQPDCIFKRPNSKFYKHVEERIRELKCTAMIVWVLDYCDHFEFEIMRMEKKLGLPILKLKSDFSRQNIGQIKTRIEAFIEMLTTSRSSIL
jgi:benzoyl-CoA reductase/2-hydroxyglutaryl-CoA dehydratase subunit BcrC/BadD/HgdB